jgi:hypothetical protein
MDIKNIIVVLIVIILFYCLTPGILINVKGNKYFIALIHALLFSGILILINLDSYLDNSYNSHSDKISGPKDKESLCPAVPKCVNANYNNAVWPWGTGTADNGTDAWKGCAPRTIASIGQNPANTVYKKDGVSTIKCPVNNGRHIGAFPFLIFDVPGTSGQNANVDTSKIDLNNPPCTYELSQFCGYANAYDKNGNVIVGTKKNPPICGSTHDIQTPILENTELVACLADPLGINAATTVGFNSTRNNGVGPLYYVSN